MEFEKSIYRIYEKTIENFVDGASPDRVSKFCKFSEYLLLVIAIFYSWQLWFLHSTFVGKSRCMPNVLHSVAIENNISYFNIQNDDILLFNLEHKFHLQRVQTFTSYEATNMILKPFLLFQETA
jgi:hypothetical protein